MNLRDAERLAKAEIEKHGLVGWRFGFTRACRQFGVCRHSAKTINVSAPLASVNDEARVLNTIKHEVAHALVGPSHGHDEVWRQKAISIGCDGERCVRFGAAVTLTPKFVGTCPNCKWEVKRFKRIRGACPLCCKVFGRFDVKFTLQWARIVA